MEKNSKASRFLYSYALKMMWNLPFKKSFWWSNFVPDPSKNGVYLNFAKDDVFFRFCFQILENLLFILGRSSFDISTSFFIFVNISTLIAFFVKIFFHIFDPFLDDSFHSSGPTRPGPVKVVNNIADFALELKLWYPQELKSFQKKNFKIFFLNYYWNFERLCGTLAGIIGTLVRHVMACHRLQRRQPRLRLQLRVLHLGWKVYKLIARIYSKIYDNSFEFLLKNEDFLK